MPAAPAWIQWDSHGAPGLVGRVDVAQERLAVHLTMACLILVALLWAARGLAPARDVSAAHRPMPRRLARSAVIILVLVVGQIALLLGVGTALVPIALVALLWLPRRLAFVRRAGAARRHLDAAADLDLFALRAVTGQPMHRLATVSDDPAGAWRRRDPAVVTRLAELELRDMGLRMPDRLRDVEPGPSS